MSLDLEVAGTLMFNPIVGRMGQCQWGRSSALNTLRKAGHDSWEGFHNFGSWLLVA
jgi:hypothetical protein